MIEQMLPADDTTLIEEALTACATAAGDDVALRLEQPPGEPPRITVNANGINCRFFPVVRRRLPPAPAVEVKQAGPDTPEPRLLVTTYCDPNQAETLCAAGVLFIDRAGNACLHAPGLLIRIAGRKPTRNTAPVRTRRIRLFAPAGLKVLFALLCLRELINRPYRDIARAARVALGTVPPALQDLKTLGHLQELGPRQRRLRNRRALAEQWAAGYLQQLRPGLKVQRFRAADPAWWRDTDLRPFQAQWGGDAAGWKLTGYREPGQIVVWLRGQAGPLLQAQRMRRDAEGDVELLDAFWDFDAEAETAPPLLVWAELLATGDPRAAEVAQRLYDERLAGLVGED